MNLKKSLGLTNKNKKYFLIGYVVLGLIIYGIWYIIWKGSPIHEKINFITDTANAFNVVVAVFSLLGFLLGAWDFDTDIFSHISNRQKEKIKILDDFAKEKWYSTDRTIYNELMNMLDRCSECKQDDIELLMLMCSPTLDYPERLKNDYSNWGKEFTDTIENIITNKKNKVKLKLYHLPNEVISGINPLYEFLESLAGFCASLPKSDKNTKDILKNILRKSDLFIYKIEQHSSSNSNITISTVEQPDVPFQIFIYKASNHCEVLVSFAGKTILQDESETKQKGFHSMDPDVVNAFEHIFNSYTAIHRRIPIKPIYTLDIIDMLKEKGKHCIENYLNMNIDLVIYDGIFSPGYANSSKFTSYVLTKILKKDDKVLDIGAGTGVQSLVSFKLLRDNFLSDNPVVWAIEPFPESLLNLKDNISKNNANITVKDWNLVIKNQSIPRRNIYTDENSIGKIMRDTDAIKLKDFENIKFDIVIGDLPYVDTKAEKSLEHAFFDHEHNAHQSLFKMFANEPYIKDNAKLITSFSSLGGIEDIIKFENLITKNDLIILQKSSFSEDQYIWDVYLIVKKKFYNKYKYKDDYDNDKNDYWWQLLNSKPKEC